MKKLSAIAIVCVAVLLPAASIALVNAQSDEDGSTPGLDPVLGNDEMMDFMIDPVYVRLKKSVAEEPEGRAGWRAIYVEAYSMAELSNLIYMRDDDEFMAEEDWGKLATLSREKSLAIVNAVREQDYAAVQEHYAALIKNCNDCHTRFAPENPTEVFAMLSR